MAPKVVTATDEDELAARIRRAEEENAKVEELIKRKGSQDFAQDLAQVGRQFYCWPLLQISK